jgi:hypothetical protein
VDVDELEFTVLSGGQNLEREFSQSVEPSDELVRAAMLSGPLFSTFIMILSDDEFAF